MQPAELTNYSLSSIGTGNGLKPFCFTLSKGDVCSIQSDTPEDARLFLRALATLAYPVNGTYLFNGRTLDFSDYRNVLFCKKQIGYIAPDTAMISNRTIRENLLFMRFYFENSLAIELDERTEMMCRMFGITDKFNVPVAKVDPLDLQIAITIRELAKAPDILLLERPEDFIGEAKIDPFIHILRDMLESEIPVVFFSFDEDFVKEYSNRSVKIQKGDLTVSPKLV